VSRHKKRPGIQDQNFKPVSFAQPVYLLRAIAAEHPGADNDGVEVPSPLIRLVASSRVLHTNLLRAPRPRVVRCTSGNGKICWHIGCTCLLSFWPVAVRHRTKIFGGICDGGPAGCADGQNVLIDIEHAVAVLTPVEECVASGAGEVPPPW
jgi:hypothetical protein